MSKFADKQQFKDFVASHGEKLVFVHFCSDWSVSCKQMNEFLTELQNEHNNAFDVVKLDAEDVSDISLEYDVRAVPTVIAFQNGKLMEKVEGFHPAKLKELVVKAIFNEMPSSALPTSVTKSNEEKMIAENENLDDRLKRLINKARLTLFMKGTPDTPKCGFSRQIVDILRRKDVDFWSFDILCDEQVRQRLKVYSDWPTYPQLYLDGELLGGLDVIREEMKDPEFVKKLPKLQQQPQ